MGHQRRACGAPLDICMTFNGVERSLVKHGIARGVDEREGLDLLDEAISHNLVQFGENVRDSVSFICNCCGCCCEAMFAAKRFAVLNPISTTNFLPRVDAAACAGCGRCAHACPTKSISLESREKRGITPVNSAHRAMAAVLGVIIKLPLARQIMASRQMKSRYLDYLFSHARF